MHPAVQKAIADLVVEGKTPSVALTKARLNGSVPMPVIIAGLSAYKNNPDIVKQPLQPISEQDTPSQSQLDRIEQKLDRLLALMEKG
ncbi:MULTISPECIES: hypothetical protein [Pseudoalteromonas]|uniref:KfrA N-terminal DNA-binding domain-containing protein n=1 Tax=Pseudoalteromonas amylolytica TaxID=1859457 RepID=A0A1S1MRP8_9GAMM|nr:MULTISPECIES: hypothetical protein [Pseudoalteromonas]MCF6436355.1 hypothetical protein [Pseudoalteromonas sp. MMG022]OHU86724.1 hypothetical protein BFC16_14600 [Pseudoalteromonas sp. JW3]OHU88751.1 hypothetical protein BET10_18155 [Pseudoalteromonas amylolytica]